MDSTTTGRDYVANSIDDGRPRHPGDPVTNPTPPTIPAPTCPTCGGAIHAQLALTYSPAPSIDLYDPDLWTVRLRYAMTAHLDVELTCPTCQTTTDALPITPPARAARAARDHALGQDLKATHARLAAYSVRDFGAVGDGAHDDGPAIQAAIDQAARDDAGRLPGAPRV